MKSLIVVLLAAGLTLAMALIAYHGADAILQSVLDVGWGIVPIVAFHALPLILTAMSWHALLRAHRPGPRWVFVWARWVREHVSYLLPVAQVGGEVVGARLLVLRGMRTAVAGASVVVDLTVEAITQVMFTLVGLGLLAWLGGDDTLFRWVGIGVSIAMLAVALFVGAQRYGLFAWLEGMLDRMGARVSWVSLGDAAGLHDTIHAIYARRKNFALAVFYHFVGWVTGAGEVWLALYFLGHPVGVAQAVFLESMGEAIRSAAFIVPAQLGVQEGAYMLLVQVVGLTPATGLALSLVKRVRIIIWGLPALLAWQMAEGRWLWTRRYR